MDQPATSKGPRRRSTRRSLRANPIPVLRRLARPVAYVALVIAAAQLLCAAAGLFMELVGFTRPGIDDLAALYMLISAGFTALVAAGLRWWGDDLEDAHLTRRDAVVVTSMVWFTAGLCGAVPFMLDAGMTPVDSFFEAISGFTTTGATVITDIEGTISRPLLLWRGLTQWLGGMGIVVLFVAIFPGLGAGGKHLFRSEVPGPTPDTLRPRITETAFYLWAMYVALSVAETLALGLAGMPWFEAVCHTFTTVSTGGFSTRDGSIGAFGNPLIEMIIVVFMLAAGANFGLYYASLRTRRIGVILRSTEFRAYLALAATVAGLLTVFNLGVHEGSLVQSARYSVFTMATFITSTGYGTENYMLFGQPALMLVLLLMFVGGSAGSTAGGLKVSRVVLTLKSLYAVVRNQVRPNVVHVVRMGRVHQPAATLLEVLAFVCIYFVSLAAGVFLVTLLEADATAGSAFGATLSCLSNMGPAPFHLGADNFAAYGDVSKLVFAFEMVLGRLEFLTVLALALPSVWRP